MLTTLVSTITYNGNDSTTVFNYPFKIWAASEIEIWITDAAGAETEITTNFTLAGVGNESGGTVTYPTTGDPLETGKKITLRRVLEVSQGFFDAVNNQAFHAETLEAAIDKTVAQIQQLKANIDLGLRGALASNIDPELPLPQAGKVLAWNATEDAIVNLAASGVVAEGSIGTTELGADAVTQVKMADNSVGTLELIDANVTTAKILDANVTFAKLEASIGVLIDTQIFTVSGTWTKPAGCNQVEVWVVGGGGGGGYAATANRIGGGGGAGGGARLHITSGLGVTETIGVGIGGAGGVGSTGTPAGNGTSSYFRNTNLCRGYGGAGTDSSDVIVAVGGAGAPGQYGDLNVYGGDGKNEYINTAAGVGKGGEGGTPPFGFGDGAPAGCSTTSQAGVTATGYGGGGGGAVTIDGTDVNGGAGAPGIVIVRSYK